MNIKKFEKLTLILFLIFLLISSDFFINIDLKMNAVSLDLALNAEGEYEISSATDLQKLVIYVNASTSNTCVGKTFKVMNDIDLSSICGEEVRNWVAIGDTNSHTFLGTFDGNNQKITNLYINTPSGDYQGLFGYVGAGGTVKNLTVSGEVMGRSCVGGVVGYNCGTVENLIVSGEVMGRSYVGGVVGQNEGIIDNCCHIGNITAEGETSGGNNLACVGGVVGYNYSGTVSNTYHTGNVTGDGIEVGGVVGWNDRGATVSNCYWLSETASEGVGTNNGTVINVEGKSMVQFSSGEVAYLLQGEQETLVWGQLLGMDQYPILTSDENKRVNINENYNPNNPSNDEETDITYANISYPANRLVYGINTAISDLGENGEVTFGLRKDIKVYNSGYDVKISEENPAKIYMPNVTYSYSIESIDPAESAEIDEGATTTPSGPNGAVKILELSENSGPYINATTTTISSTGILEFKNTDYVQISDGEKKFVDGSKYLMLIIDPTKFNDIGIYRYKITESVENGDLYDAGVTRSDSYKNIRYLDVYVKFKRGGGFKIFHYTLFEKGASAVKTEGFIETNSTGVDEYHTHNLKVRSEVHGGLADLADKFKITMTTEAMKGEVYCIAKYNQNGGLNSEIVAENREEAYKLGQATDYDLGDTGIFSIADGGYVIFVGLPQMVAFNITETNENTKAYNLTITDGAEEIYKSEALIQPNGVSSIANEKVLVADYDEIVFNNELSEVSPTGVSMRRLPYIVLLLISGLILGYLMKKIIKNKFYKMLDK